MSEDRRENFLARWARRKREDADGAKTPAAADPHVPGDTGDAEAPVDLASLPKVEDLTRDSDFAAFLRRGVPEELKRLALRRAWSLDPTIRDFVEMAENQYDWNVPGGVPGFGELPPGTDIEALLAQATGEIKDALTNEMSGDAVAPVVTVPAASKPTVGSGEVAPSPSAPHVRRDEIKAASETGSLAEQDASAPASREGQTRLRHGGALPEIRTL